MEARRIALGVLGAGLICVGGCLRGSASTGVARILAELDAAPRSPDAVDPGRVRPDDEGRLVLVRGLPRILQPARSDDGRVQTARSLVLASDAQRYKATGRKNSDGTGPETYHWISTGGGASWFARTALGELDVEPRLYDGLDVTKDYALDEAALARLEPKAVISPSEVFYGSGTPAAPAVGDLRVSYRHAPLTEVTVFARLRGGRLERVERTIEVLGFKTRFDIGVAARGPLDANAMISIQRDAIARSAASPRLLGLVAVTLGGYLLLAAGGPWDSRRRFRTHVAQLAVVAPWVFVGFLIPPFEKLIMRLTANPFLLAAAIVTLVAGLAAVMIAAQRALARPTA